MTQLELANIIHNTLNEMLIEDTKWHKDQYQKAYYSTTLFKITEEWGKEVHVKPVYRSNGTEKDVSMIIETIEWNGMIGKIIAKIKITPAKKEETIAKKVRKFVEENYK